jgi:hypothetical protein
VKISIKDLSINMDLGNNGVTFDVYGNDGKFLGDLRLGKGTVEWCKGKTQAGNGVKVKWNDLIKFFEQPDAEKKPAKKKTAREKVAV